MCSDQKNSPLIKVLLTFGALVVEDKMFQGYKLILIKEEIFQGYKILLIEEDKLLKLYKEIHLPN